MGTLCARRRLLGEEMIGENFSTIRTLFFLQISAIFPALVETFLRFDAMKVYSAVIVLNFVVNFRRFFSK